MNIEQIAVSELRPATLNVRLHPEAQIAEIVRSVRMFGQTRPMVVDETNTVLVGNGLLAALKSMGTPQASVLRFPDLSAAEKTKLMLSDNKIFELGFDDYDNIMILVKGMDDLDIPGFDQEILQTLVSGDAAAAEALQSFGTLTQEEISQRRARGEQTDGEVSVTCPHCQKSFVIE